LLDALRWRVARSRVSEPWQVGEKLVFAELFKGLAEAADEEAEGVIDEFEAFESEALAGDRIVRHGR
jgi:hypothetical protein